MPVLLCAMPLADTLAQQPQAIEEIQVTASRRPLATSKVSAAVTVVASRDIAMQKLATDALASQLGVFLQQTTVGQGAPIIRGMKGSEVLHLVDGLRLNNAIFRNAPTQYLALIAPGSIERMEVVRGSPTSLYGSDAVGGVIQVISRLPQFESDRMQWRREFSVAADTAEQSRSARLSVDGGTRRSAGLLSVAWQEAGNRRIGGGERIAPSSFESYSLRGAWQLRPADDRSWLFDAQFTRQPETPRVDEMVPGFGQTEPSSAEFYFEPNARHFAHLRHTRDNGLWSSDWTIDLGWQRIDDDRRNRDFGSDQRRFEENSSDLFGVSVNASREFGNASWVYGAELYHDEVRSARLERDINTGDVTVLQSRFPDGAKVDQAAVFANISHDAGTRHTLSGGLRFSQVDIDLPATTLSPAAAIGINDFSADTGWVFRLNDSTRIAANIGYGFRAPNVFDLGTQGDRPGNRFNVPNPTLESERVLQYDIGLRRQTDNWSAELVVYQLDYTDRIQSMLTGEVTTDGREIVQSRNIGRAEVYGFEAGLNWHPAGALSAEFLLNHTRGEQRESDGSVVAGDRMPPLNGRASVYWEINDAFTLKSSLVFADAQRRLSPRDVGDTRINPFGTDGWSTAGVAITWRRDPIWTIDAGVENVLDENYRVHGSGIDAPGINVFLNANAVW